MERLFLRKTSTNKQKSCLISAFVVFLAFVTPNIAQGSPPASSEPNSHETPAQKSKQSVQPAAGFTIEVGNSPELDKTHPVYVINSTPEKSWPVRLVDDPDDFLIALFTVVLGIAAIYQGRLLYKQDEKLNRSLKVAEASSASAEGGVKAAVEANSISRETAKQQLRAYLSVDRYKEYRIANIENNTTTNGPQYSLSYYFNITNCGQTPATNVTVKVACAKGINDGFDVKSYVANILSDRNRIFDFYEFVGVIHASAHHTIIETPIRNIDVGGDFKKNIVTILMIEYLDAFGDMHLETRTSFFQTVNGGSKEILYPEGCVST
jgi:hypothetical protein